MYNPSIEQFRNVIKSVSETARYLNSEKDENGNIIPGPKTWKLPTISYIGTVKLHGTNASVVYDCYNETLTAQSRNRVLTLDNDNAGFAEWVESKKEHLIQGFKDTISDAGYDDFIKEGMKVVLYGEWAGPGIQKNVGISMIEKRMFFPFNLFFINDDDKVINVGSNIEMHLLYNFDSDDIHSIYGFKTWKVDIDFENPHLAQNEFIRITTEVENECPVAKYFGFSGLGEGVVWKPYYDGESKKWFKVKGEKHSVSKVKTLAPVDVEKIEKMQEFVDSVVTEARLQQGIDFLREMNKQISQKSTGDFIRWIVNDVNKEEADTIETNGLDPKEVNKAVGTTARKWFFEKGIE